MVSPSDSTHAIQRGHVLVQRHQFALCYWGSYDGGYHLRVLGHETGKRQRRQEQIIGLPQESRARGYHYHQERTAHSGPPPSGRGRSRRLVVEHDPKFRKIMEKRWGAYSTRGGRPLEKVLKRFSK